jgi:succinyl-diaminopimelate desuccinylase
MDTDDVIALTEELVRYRSTEDRPEEIADCLAAIEERFADEVYTIDRYDINGTKALIIGFEETREPDIMLHGHIDVVEAPEEMFKPVHEGERMYGRGTADMKAGVACLIAVMEQLADRDDRPSVALMIVSDEERGGYSSAGHLVEHHGIRPGFAISAEPNNLDGYMDIVTKQKGLLRLRLMAGGTTAHGSRPWLGENAAETLMERYDEVMDLFPDGEEKTWATTASTGILRSGDAPNQVPDHAEAILDVRWSDEYPANDVIDDISAIDGLEIEVMSKDPMLDTPDDEPHVQALQQATEETTGQECRVTRKEPASDMRFFANAGIPAVVFGPEGYNSHGPDEHTVTSSFRDYIESLLRFIEDAR